MYKKVAVPLATCNADDIIILSSDDEETQPRLLDATFPLSNEHPADEIVLSSDDEETQRRLFDATSPLLYEKDDIIVLSSGDEETFSSQPSLLDATPPLMNRHVSASSVPSWFCFDVEELFNAQEASNSQVAAHKRKHPDDFIKLERAVENPMDSSERSSSSNPHKKPKIRVPRRASVFEDGDENDASRGVFKRPNRYQERSRDIRPIYYNEMHGILGSDQQNKVSIVKSQKKIHEIEPSSSPLSTKTPIPPVDRDVLTNNVLYRICNWRYDWVEDRKKYSHYPPPPLLQELHRENGASLPELSLLPVALSYDSLESYCGIFTSLMLHETWASLCQEMDTTQLNSLSPLIYSDPKLCDGFALLNCEALSPTRVNDMDLVTLTVPQNSPSKFFGVVKDVVNNRNWQKGKVDQRLLETCQENALNRRILFVLWIKMSDVPKELNQIFTITKIVRLSTIVKPLILNAELLRSPLCDVILNPYDNVEAFELNTVSVEEKHALLNPSQFKAVESIASTMVYSHEPKVALLHGPSGTGKSLVIVELISRMMSMQYEKTHSYPCILVCAPSNNAIDEVVNRLMIACHAKNSRYHILRIGVPASMHPNVLKISLDELTNELHRKTVVARVSPESERLRSLTEELNTMQKMKTILVASNDAANKSRQSDETPIQSSSLEQLEIKIAATNISYQECYIEHASHFKLSERRRLQLNQQVISQTSVICTTLNFCRSRQMENLFSKGMENKSFLCCILDEASQCTEPESLTPLSLGVRKLVLIGDPNQLPATVISQVAAKNGFDQSLFNRLYTTRTTGTVEGVMMLNTQYRMAPSICEWPSEYFYSGKLVTAERLVRNGPCYNYRVLNVIDGLEQITKKSFRNEKEAALVSKIVVLIENSTLTRGKSIGIITFYQSQAECITNKINEEISSLNASRVEVNTVDSFQGREKDIVIVSCVRAFKGKNRNGNIGFIDSKNRLNVALTRAKESLIICGNFETLTMNETWKDLITNARNRDVVQVVTSDYTSDNLRPLLMRPVPNI